MNNKPRIPNPIINEKEAAVIPQLEKKYNKLIEPNALIKIGNRTLEKLPDGAKEITDNAKAALGEKELIKQALKMAMDGFQILENIAAQVTVSEKAVIKRVNKTFDSGAIDSLDEVCYARAYDLARLANRYKKLHILGATVEGAGTGALGFAGIIPNFVISIFLYFRAVQSVAMHYGYDVKNDPNELEIAYGVFMSSLSPGSDLANNELTATVGKFMVFTETTAVQQAAKKSWSAMAEHGGLGLLITQIRALANNAAKKALETAGKKGLEQTVFKSILEQLGKQTTLKSTGRAMPVVGGVFGALFDTAQMQKIVDYADIFYQKRFIEEKEVRINYLFDPESVGTPEDALGDINC